MPWQFVQGTGCVDCVPEGSGKLPVLVVMSETCTVQVTSNKTIYVKTRKMMVTIPQKCETVFCCKKKGKVIPLHAMEAHGVRGGIATTYS
jgi:hypothetical protein